MNDRRKAARLRAEAIFMTALNRLVQKRIQEGNDIKIDMTALAEEAGYARSYLYKFPIPAVLDRLRDIQSEEGSVKSIRSKTDAIKKLREERDQLRAERDVAVETSRRLMLELLDFRARG